LGFAVGSREIGPWAKAEPKSGHDCSNSVPSIGGSRWKWRGSGNQKGILNQFTVSNRKEVGDTEKATMKKQTLSALWLRGSSHDREGLKCTIQPKEREKHAARI
jgi:hypothetical protein